MQRTNQSDPNPSTRTLHPEKPERPHLDTAALALLLEGWMRDDPEEQRETFAVLRRSLDEDRPEGYKLFS